MKELRISTYRCSRCQFSIETSRRFYYRLEDRFYMTVLCTNCQTIHHVRPHLPTITNEEALLHYLKELDTKSRLSKCPKCGERGHFQLWQPSDLCPKCRSILINESDLAIIKEPGPATATIQEMKAEALARMKAIGLYDASVEAFEQEDEVQVYEPPYGCAYGLEEDDEKSVNDFQAKHGALVWGVIRTFFSLSGEELTGDSYLYVSDKKDLWEEERELLYKGTPTVFTIVKEHPELNQIGSMKVYKSEGGTLLQDYSGRE